MYFGVVAPNSWVSRSCWVCFNAEPRGPQERKYTNKNKNKNFAGSSDGCHRDDAVHEKKRKMPQGKGGAAWLGRVCVMSDSMTLMEPKRWDDGRMEWHWTAMLPRDRATATA